MTPPDVVTFGEIMGNFIAETTGPLAEATRFERRLAGAELNVAVGVARLGHAVAFVGRVGEDPIGEHARAMLAGEGVDTTHLVTDPRAATGLQLKERAEAGDPRVVYYRRGAAGSLLEPSDEVMAFIQSARHLHATGIPPALSTTMRTFSYAALEAARSAGVSTSFDPNLRPSLWPDCGDMVRVVNDLACRADWVLPGLVEGEILTGHTDPAGIAGHYLDRGARGVAVKLGAAGAELFTASGSWTCGPYPVTVVDTVGAGDGFAAGLISADLDGLDPVALLARACAVGALATTNDGDCDGMPTRPEIDALVSSRVPQQVRS